MRVLVATDAWHPQVNGVVHTLTSLSHSARRLGVNIEFLTPAGFPCIPIPTYPGLRLALPRPRAIGLGKTARVNSSGIFRTGRATDIANPTREWRWRRPFAAYADAASLSPPVTVRH